MAIADQDVGPAVVVEIKKSASPSQELRVRAQSGCERRVFEGCVAQIVIERGRVAREIRLHQVQIAVEIVISRGDSHPSLRFAVWTQRTACLERDVDKLAVLLILIERAGSRVIGDINVRPPVIIEIGRQNAQSVCAVRAEDSRTLGYIGERSIAVVVIENVLSPIHSRRPACHHHSFVEARAGLRHRRRLQVHIDIVRDK